MRARVLLDQDHVRCYFYTHTMFQFQYELMFTCAYACRFCLATCACRSCAIDYEHNMIMMKPVHCSHSLSICTARDATTILITCACQIKAVCSLALRTSLWTKISAPTYHSPEHFSAALFSTTFSATRSGSHNFTNSIKPCIRCHVGTPASIC